MKDWIKSNMLLPRWASIVAWSLLMPGFAFAIIRFFYGKRLPFLDLRVFAIYSSYFEKKYFMMIDNSISEELPGVLLLAGLFLLAFARKKKEHLIPKEIRTQAMVLSIYINTFFMIAAFLFVFGLGFIEILIINIYTTLLFFLLIFNFLYYKTLLKNK